MLLKVNVQHDSASLRGGGQEYFREQRLALIEGRERSWSPVARFMSPPHHLQTALAA